MSKVRKLLGRFGSHKRENVTNPSADLDAEMEKVFAMNDDNVRSSSFRKKTQPNTDKRNKGEDQPHIQWPSKKKPERDKCESQVEGQSGFNRSASLFDLLTISGDENVNSPRIRNVTFNLGDDSPEDLNYTDTENLQDQAKRKKKMAEDDNENSETQRGNVASTDESYQLILQLSEPMQGIPANNNGCNIPSPISSSVLTSKKGNESIISSLPIKIFTKQIDRSPHEVFVQLDELKGIGEEREWKETARWIKYEEDVEEGSNRWGKPHVASLSFHSLLNLRRCLENGVIMLDMEEEDLPGVAFRVVEKMTMEHLIKEEEVATVLRALLLKHRHVNDNDRFTRFIRRNTASYTSLQNIEQEFANYKGKMSCTSVDIASTLKHFNEKNNHTALDMKEETLYASSNEDLERKYNRDTILKRIPIGAEATTVLVGTVDFLQQPTTAFVRLAKGICIPNVTEVTIPVRFMFILLGPPDADVDYHEIGRSISTLMSNSDFHKKAYKASGRQDLLSAINEFLDYSIVLPPGDWEREALLSLRELKAKNDAIRRRHTLKNADAEAIPSPKSLLLSDGSGGGKKDPFQDPLRRTRRPFGGMINDIKRRYPFYSSDFTDGLNGQCFSAALFMYFAAVSAAITFGGLMAGKTDHLIGITETLVATSLAGILFALTAGQPLIVIGSTGPLLMFDESLRMFCEMRNIEYLPMRMYVGVWILLIALVVASVEGSVFVKMFTRFTEEIFSTLISLIYIYESVGNIVKVFDVHPMLNGTEYCSRYSESPHFAMLTGGNLTTEPISLNANLMEDAIDSESKISDQPNTALFSLILCLGTFFLAYYLRHFRNSKFLGRSARRALGDFGVPIAIVLMVALGAFNNHTYTDKLNVPDGLSPSLPKKRGWFILPYGYDKPFPVWASFAALVPALLLYILVFMETHITELIIGKKERKLRKGNGFHLDIVLVCFANTVCGVIGAPYMCAASVRSITHVSAVTIMSTTHAPGEKPHIKQVKEQRVSALVVSALVGASVLMSSYLRLVPMAVLFGVFLYMGISSMEGVQFLERIKLFFVPVKHHPQSTYIRRVHTIKMHLFTMIQLSCLIILWAVKSSRLALALPFFLLLLIPLRAQLVTIFSSQELRALDSDEPDAIDRDDDEPDFYVESCLPG